MSYHERLALKAVREAGGWVTAEHVTARLNLTHKNGLKVIEKLVGRGLLYRRPRPASGVPGFVLSIRQQ